MPEKIFLTYTNATAVPYEGSVLRHHGAHNTDSPFQRLQIKPEHTDSDVSMSQPHTIVAEGDDLSPRWALVRDFADEVNSIGARSTGVDA